MSVSLVAARRHTARIAAALLLGVIALVSAFSWGSSAMAAGTTSPYPPQSNCVVSGTTTANPGGSVQVTGSGFDAGSTVSLTLHSTPTGLGSVTADASGAFTTSVTIPSSVTGTAHLIVAAEGNKSCSYDPFPTSGVDAVSAVATSSSSGLASTGFETIAATAIGVALLGGGAMFIVVGRRRRA